MGARKQSFELASWRVGPLPIINRFLEQLRVEPLLRAHLEPTDPRAALPTEQVLMALIRNLIVERHPLYALGAWAESFLPPVLGLPEGGAAKLNDDRVGRALDRLFDADRVSLLTELVLHLLEAFAIDTRQLHNDSTTLTLHGAYRRADGRPMRGKPTPAAARGHSKDYRPDLKQLLWILTVSSDGGVPVHFKVSSGNTEDSSTHIETWNRLRELVGRADFIYVADSKLCALQNMRHIDDQGGRFITIMPRSRKEDGLFRRWLLTHSPTWEPIAERPHPRLQNGPPDVIMAMESPLADPHGFRILWYFSSHKMQRDADWREHQLNKAISALESLRDKLEGPKCRYRTRRSVTNAVDKILAETQSADFIAYTVTLHQEVRYRSIERGDVVRKYRQGFKTRYVLEWTIETAAIRAASKSDGVFPLMTNALELSALEVFNAYRAKQPVIEKRHDLFKNVLEATPAYLKNIGRLEALLFLEFIALIVHALIERQLRHSMLNEQIESLPLYPEMRSCKAPTTDRLFALFAPVQHHRLSKDGFPVQQFPPQLDELQQTMIELAGLEPNLYQQAVEENA
jgi:transposase